MARQHAVPLKGLRGRIARRILGGPDLRHNGVPVDHYPDPDWWVSVFPSQKGRPWDSDNLATVNSRPFMSDPRFLEALRAAEGRWPEGQVRDVAWRLHVAVWSARTACLVHPTGDLVELGTGRGYMAAGICSSLGAVLERRRFILVDRFSRALPEAEVASAGAAPAPFCYSDDSEEVSEYFARHPSVTVIPADLPGGTGSVPSDRIAWVHVDLNDGDVEVDSLRRLRHRLLPRAIVLFDDTGHPGYAASGAAHLELVAEWGTELLVLPTGQGLAVLPG